MSSIIVPASQLGDVGTSNNPRTGSGAPAGTLGSNGEWYKDTATGTVYEKRAGTWTAADCLIASGTGIKTSATFFQSTGADGTYTLIGRMPFSGFINSATCSTTSGTATAAVKIGSTACTGLSAVSVTSTPGTTSATAANTFATGDVVKITISSSSTPVDLMVCVNITGSAA